MIESGRERGERSPYRYFHPSNSELLLDKLMNPCFLVTLCCKHYQRPSPTEPPPRLTRFTFNYCNNVVAAINLIHRVKQ